MSIPTIDVETFQGMSIAQQLHWAVNELGSSEGLSPEIRDIFKDAASVISALTERGAVSSATLESLLREVGALVDGAQQPAPPAAPAESSPVEEESVSPQPEAAPVQPSPPRTPNLYEYLNELSADLGEIFKDNKGRLRTADGKYVCKACVAEFRREVYIADSPRQLGPHMKAHEDKTGGWVNDPEYAGLFKPFEAPIEAPRSNEVAPSAPQPVEAEVEHIVDEEEASSFAPSMGLYGEAAYPEGEPQPHTQLDLSEVEKLLDSKLQSLETTIATLVLVLLSLPEDAKKALYERFGADKVSELADVLMRGKS